MSKEHDAYPQIRVQPDVAAEMVRLKASSGYTSMSMAAFADSILRKGIRAEKLHQHILKTIGDKPPYTVDQLRKEKPRKVTLKELQG